MRITPRGLARKAAILVAVVGLIAVAAPAAAAIKGPQTTDVSCDGVTVKSGVSIVQGRTGNFSIKQNSTSPSSSTVTWAVSANGNSLSTRTVGNGGTGSWTSVLPSTYTVRAYRSGNANCNGILPGAGNYKWNYTVTSTS